MGRLRVLITNHHLATHAGTEIYARDLAVALAKRGHEPVVYSPVLGKVAKEIAEAGVEVVNDVGKVVIPPDVIHGHHTVPTLDALRRFRTAPGLYVCHDATWYEDAPPMFPRILRYVAVDQNCRKRVRKAGVPAHRIRVIYNAVDLERFRARGPLPQHPRRALLFSNYANERTHLPAVREACARAGLPLDVIGAGIGRTCRQPETVLAQYDLVFAKARCALEAMAVGAAVVLCDFRGMGPMVTSGDVEELRRWNFGMRTLRWPAEPERLLREMGRYDPCEATEVSRRIRATAGLDGWIDQLLTAYEEVLSEHSRRGPPNFRQEALAAAACVRKAQPPVPVRDRLRRIPWLGRALVLLKRAVMGPWEWD